MGVDIGGTKVLAVIVDAAGTVVDRVLAKTQSDGPEAVASHVARLLAKLDPDAVIDSVGVGVPGVITNGVVERAVNLAGWDKPVDFGSLLAASTGRRVTLANDASMSAIAEHRFGSAEGVDNVLHVAVGTGVGGALILDGKLRVGPGGVAGEIGHMAVPNLDRAGLEAPTCACGGVGHLEAFLGRASLERRARAAHRDGVATVLVAAAGEKRMTSTIWVDALASGDELALRLVGDATRALAEAISAAVVLLDLELVVIGGGFASRLGGTWRARVAEAHAETMTVGRPARIKGSGIGDNAAALGAAQATLL